MKWLIAQLDANGDCLYATAIARRIRALNPDASIEWAISSRCRHLLDGNSHVDNIIEIPVIRAAQDHRQVAWYRLEREISRLPVRRDRVVYSQIWPSNFRRFDGTIRSSMLRGFHAADGGEILPFQPDHWADSVDPELNLTADELGNANSILDEWDWDNYEHCITFECSPQSGQSFVDLPFALRVAEELTRSLPRSCVILSTGEVIANLPRHVFSGKDLSIRQNQRLIERSCLFIGCGSGLSVVATSIKDPPPQLQILSGATSMFASFHHDFEYFGKDTETVVEIIDATVDEVAAAARSICLEGAGTAKRIYHRPASLHFDYYLDLIDQMLVVKGRYLDAGESLAHTICRYGNVDSLTGYYSRRVAPLIRYDAHFQLPSGNQQWNFIRQFLPA